MSYGTSVDSEENPSPNAPTFAVPTNEEEGSRTPRAVAQWKEVENVNGKGWKRRESNPLQPID